MDSGLTFRPAAAADAERAFEVYRRALNDYLSRAGQKLVPAENDRDPAFLHMLRHDAERTWVAVRASEVVAYGGALVRGDWWYLGSLFVLPEAQGFGVGGRLLDLARTGEPHGCVRATVADSLQPISNTLYARRGMLPREILLGMCGRSARRPSPARLGRLAPQPLTVADMPEMAVVDAAALGLERTVDHRFHLREGGRRGWLFRRAGRPAAYALYRENGWIGPLASVRAADVEPVLRFVLAELSARGIEKAHAIVPAPCAGAQRVLWEAGFVYEATPGLALASRPFGRLDRYLPANYGMF